jgi:hypothetical protein
VQKKSASKKQTEWGKKVEVKTEAWRRVLEERGLKINRKKTEYLSFNEANKKSISMQG